METLKDNIVLLCKFYQPKEKYVGKKRDLSKQRDFVSCNSSYNYVSYVDTGATNKVPKDYEMYVGNKEKSCGAFSKNGLLTDKEKRELREMLRTTQSNIWDMVVSFREDFGNAYCRDYDQAYEFCKSELPKFLSVQGLIQTMLFGMQACTKTQRTNTSTFRFLKKSQHTMRTAES